MEWDEVTVDWKRMMDFIHNGVIIVNGVGKIVYMNKSAKGLLHLENQEVIGEDIRHFVPETKLPDVIAKGLSTIGEEIMLFDKQCIVNRTPIYENGKRNGAISILQDITEVQQYQNLLKQLEAIVESTTDGIYVVDHQGITLYVNKAYEEITGFHRDDLLGKHMKLLMEEGYIDQSVSLLVLEKKEKISIMQSIQGKKDVIVTGNPVFDEKGEIKLIVTSVRDITLLNEMKKELIRAKSFSKMNHHRYSYQLGHVDEEIVFKSKRMREIYEQVQQVAPYPTSILLTGPSGAGKEVVANLIHHTSNRKKQPFIKVNCGAIPETLLESELFGYVEGAFTGARKQGKIGLLELADKGTLLLDEIGEMPLSLQVKLLRVLQDKQLYRIGSSEPIQLDVRVISATNKNLKELIQLGKFREDLYYRLNVVEMHIPPLAERREDIELLIDYFFQYYSTQYHITKEISKEAKEILLSYEWPGNVRELKNMVENLIISVPSTVIELDNLPVHISDTNVPGRDLSLKERVERFEKRIVLDAIKRSPSLRQAAKDLGVNHSTLVKKLQRWNEGGGVNELAR